MTLSNLPPGVTVNMIPGCRPEDEAYEHWVEEVFYYLDTETVKALNDRSVDRAINKKFLDDVDIHNVSPATQAMKIDKYVEELNQSEENYGKTQKKTRESE